MNTTLFTDWERIAPYDTRVAFDNRYRDFLFRSLTESLLRKASVESINFAYDSKTHNYQEAA